MRGRVNVAARRHHLLVGRSVGFGDSFSNGRNSVTGKNGQERSLNISGPKIIHHEMTNIIGFLRMTQLKVRGEGVGEKGTHLRTHLNDFPITYC